MAHAAEIDALIADNDRSARDADLVLEFARVDDWILVTANLRDFRPLHAQRAARSVPARRSGRRT